MGGAAAAAVVDEEIEEIHITIVDMIDMTVMMSMTTDTGKLNIFCCKTMKVQC